MVLINVNKMSKIFFLSTFELYIKIKIWKRNVFYGRRRKRSFYERPSTVTCNVYKILSLFLKLKYARAEYDTYIYYIIYCVTYSLLFDLILFFVKNNHAFIPLLIICIKRNLDSIWYKSVKSRIHFCTSPTELQTIYFG